MEDKSIRDECISFDLWLKNTTSDLYDDFLIQNIKYGGVYLPVIKHLRKSNFSNYYFITKVIRFLDKIIQEKL